MGQFKVKKVTKLSESKPGDELPESDYSLLVNDNFIQWEYIRDEDKIEPINIKPGVWTIVKSMQGFSLVPTEFTKEHVLQEYVVTDQINKKISTFFEKSGTYTKYGIFPKRGWLLYGKPGCGKSCAITNVCTEQTKNNETAVVVWHTDKYEPSEVSGFIKAFDYEKNNVKRFILIAEDIGGIEIDQVRMKSDSSLLSLLDNVEKTFKVPTAIIATTNFISNFLENLTNRPGRFDDKIEVKTPPAKARAEFLKFFSNGEVESEALIAIQDNRYNDLSVAHIKDAFIRAKIYDISIVESLNQIKKEIDLYNKAFENRASFGMSISDE